MYRPSKKAVDIFSEALCCRYKLIYVKTTYDIFVHVKIKNPGRPVNSCPMQWINLYTRRDPTPSSVKRSILNTELGIRYIA